MLFKNFRKNKKLMKNYEVIIYDEVTGDKLYHDILPVGVTENGSKMYKGLLDKITRDYYDSIFIKYGEMSISDKEIDDDYKQIFLYLIK